MTDEQRNDVPTDAVDADHTQVIGPEPDLEATQQIDTVGPAPAEQTAVLPETELRAERERQEREARLQREREAAERAEADRRKAEADRIEAQRARERALGTVTPAQANDEVEVPVIHKRVTDKFLGSLGLFLLRLVTAAILGVHGYQKLTDHAATTDFFTQVGLPRADLMAWGVGVAEVLAAIALVFGFLMRIVGVGVAAIAIGALVMVKWGSKNPFQPGQSGFIGEFELLLAGVGILFLCLGGGGWGIDGGYRRGRQRRKLGLQ